MSALVDVLLPVYNAQNTLQAAIESLINQTLSDFRLIIVDDGSSDGSAQIIDRFAASDSRITLVRQQNAGIVDALNNGLELSDAPFVARQDSDDISNPDRLARQVAFLSENAGVAAVSGAVRHIDSEGRPLDTHIAPSPDACDMDWIPAVEPYLIHPFLMVRRDHIISIGGYRHVHNSEDTDLYWRLLERGRLHNLTDVLGDYRMHTASISGASAVNGRIMAVHSQLAALSARRRRAGAVDLTFDRDSLAAYRSAGALDSMTGLASVQIQSDERQGFYVAVAGKLLELSSYRPWSLDADDCGFIRRQWSAARPSLAPRNRTELRKSMMRAGAKLLRKGDIRGFFGLLPPDMFIGSALRGVLYAARPSPLRHKASS